MNPNQVTPYNANPYGTYNPGPNPYMNTFRNYGNYAPENYMQMQNNQQALGQPTQQPQAPIQPQQNMQFILVPSVEVAQNITADKGQTVYMMNQNKPEIYAKAADGFGLQTTKYFRMYEFDPAAEAQAQAQANQPTQQLMTDYTPREEYNQFVTAVSAEIAAIKQAMANDTTQTAKPSTAKKTASKEAAKETE